MKDYFDFKLFRVHHDQCGMKVGTDSVLLGSWADLDGASHILDVGCGSGILSLMLAQRYPEAQITAIDCDVSAVAQAKKNVECSPFASRIEVKLADVRTDFPDVPDFDAIICNPPYFEPSTAGESSARRTARFTEAMPATALARFARKSLSPSASKIHLVLPCSSVHYWTDALAQESFLPSRQAEILTVPRKLPKRTLITLSSLKSFSKRHALIKEQIVLSNEDGSRSDQYKALAHDFYLF